MIRNKFKIIKHYIKLMNFEAIKGFYSLYVSQSHNY